ncbi:MAG: RNA-binding domain-containing protein [Candidatus Micrarchaeota archaeon]
MDLIALLEIIRKGECERVEFRSTADKRAGETICAFLNTTGGTLLIGIDDGGKIIGCPADSADKIDNYVSAIYPRIIPKSEMQEIDGKRVLIVTVPKSERLHTFGNVGYIRVGRSSRSLELDEILQKAAESLMLRFDEAICIDASLSDISETVLSKYLERRKMMRGVEAPETDHTRTLEMLKAVSGGKATNAGILFFCDYPERFHPGAQLRFIEFRSDDMRDVAEERTFNGSIWRISDEFGAFVENKVPRESLVVGLEKKAGSKFPLEAIREALNNALIHRNYVETADVKVFLFPDRLEIVNPGSFPADVTPEMPAHRPRNQVLCQYFFDVGKVDKYGSGLEKMKRLCIDGGYPAPEFALSARQTRVVFRFIPLKAREMMSGLDDIDRRIVSEVSSRKRISTGQLAKVVPLSRISIVSRLNRLIEKNIIKRNGIKRGTTYELA